MRLIPVTFQTQIAAIPALTDAERAGLERVVTIVKRDHVKTIQVSNGRKARLMEPRLRHGQFGERHAEGSHNVTWVSIPYFSLERQNGLMGPKQSAPFLTPTLLQSRFSRTTRSRDMEQAVCQLKGAPQGYCFHVAQLWCLVLDSCMLLRCGMVRLRTSLTTR